MKQQSVLLVSSRVLMVKRNSKLDQHVVKCSVLLILSTLIVLIGTQRLVAQTNIQPTASNPLATPTDQNQILLSGAIVKAPPSIKVPGLRAGLLTKVDIHEGMRVAQGQFLARTDPVELQLDLNQSKLDHQLAQMNANNNTDKQYYEKSLVVATAEVNRAIAANARVRNSVPVAKLEKQRLEQERATLQLQQANRQLEIAQFRTRLTQSKIESAEAKLAKTTIVSPVSGLVVNVDKQAGEWLEQSEIVCEIVSTDRLRVEGYATVAQAAQIKTGMTAVVQFNQPWIKTKRVPGTVTFVAPTANPLNLLVPIWVEIDNRNQEIIAGVAGNLLIDTQPSGSNSANGEQQ